MSTADKLRAFLADPSFFVSGPYAAYTTRNGFDQIVVRYAVVCVDGTTVSVQQGASHYCTKDANTFELWNCPHSELLAPYGDGDVPYAHVPFATVVAYLDEHGGMS